MSERNPIGAGRGDLMPSAKTKLGDGYYFQAAGIPDSSPATNDGGTDVHEWASVHVIFYADDTDYTNLYLTVRPWRWYPTAREGHGPTDPQGRWIPDKLVEVALDPGQVTTIRGSHYAWPTRDAERMYWQIVSCVDVGATTNEPNWVVIQPYGLSRTDALEVLASSGDGGGGGGGGIPLAQHDDPVILKGPQEMAEAKDFDGTALPNVVAEGDAVRIAATLRGIQFGMLVNEDGSAKPAVPHDAVISAANGGTIGLMSMLEAKAFDGVALPNNVAEGDALRQAATLHGVGFSMPVTKDGSKTAIVDHDAAISNANGGTAGIVSMMEARSTLPTAVAAGDAARPIGDLYGRQMGAAFTLTSQSDRKEEIQPLNDKYVPESLVDDTDLTAATHYYPSATGATMDSWKDLSFTGKLIDADGTVTLTLEGTNDEDTAAGDWHDITLSGYRPDNNTTGNANITVTNGTVTFAIDFDELNYTSYRVVIVCSGATNTVIVKQRKKAL